MRIIKKKILTTLAILGLLSLNSINAQNVEGSLGTFTPYSMYGLGDLSTQGTAYHKGMGGIGAGIRSNRYVNYLNTASITQRDTLSFMMDFGVQNKNLYTADSRTTSAYNTFGMFNFAMSFPIYKKSAFILGITPVSDVGYKFRTKETDLDLINELGDITYLKKGSGGVNRIFLGGAMTFAKYISIGLEGSYYFGEIARESDVSISSYTVEGSENTSYNYINTGNSSSIRGFGAKASLQYSQPLGQEMNLTIGATYGFSSDLNSNFTKYAYSIALSQVSVDTTMHTVSKEKITLPAELTVGFSLAKRDKWSIGFDYLRQDWSETSFPETPGVNFKGDVMQSFKGGFEFIPNRYDIRYYMKRVTYRGGVYHNKSYMNFNGHQINSTGVTLGMTLPITQRYHTGISVALDLGQRGTTSNNLIRERYFIFSINLNLHDIWFQQFRYD